MTSVALRDAWRSLRRSPGFALMIVGMLTVGVGLNAAIFAVVDSVLLRPLGYHDADRIVSVQTRYITTNRLTRRIGGGDYVDLARQVRGLEATAYYNDWAGGVQVRGQASLAQVAHVSPRFFQVMGVTPLAGRLFQPDDSKGTDAVVSASFAREHFHTAGAALGQTLRVEGSLFPIIGVLPDGFGFPDNAGVWVEADAEPEAPSRTAYNQRAIAKRRADVSPALLEAELANFSKQLQQTYPEDRPKVLEAMTLQESIVGAVAPTLHLLLGSVALVLLIVCANITHLQLVRATRQARELAVRTALGASRGRLALQAIAEALCLSITGCAGAVLVALPALRLLVRLAPTGLPRLAEVQFRWHVLLASLLVSSAVMTAAALVPVWRSWHVDQASTLRQDSTRGLDGHSGVRLRSVFLVTQIALSLVLAATALLLARQWVAQSREDLGFDMEHLYTLDASLIETQPSRAAANTAEADLAQKNADSARLAHLDHALDTLRTTPGVLAAEAIQGAPLGFGGVNVGYAIRGKSTLAAGANLPTAEMKAITPGALTALHVPLLRGRSFNSADRAGTTPVLLVSKQLADTVFPGEDPVGEEIMCGYDRTSGWWTIVGVTGSLKTEPGSAPEQTMYVPVAQHPARASSMQLLVRTARNAQLSEEALRLRLTGHEPDIAATSTSMAQNRSEVQRDLRFRTILFESFAVVSVLLAMLGIYGATAYAVVQRRFELGLRMALGASRQQVVGSVLRAFLWLAMAGAVAGIALYAAMLRLSSAFLGKLPNDPVGVALAVAATLLLSLTAAAIPARRASTIDPMRALRSE